MTAAAPSRSPRPARGRRRAWLLAVGIGVLLAAVVAGFLLLREDEPSPGPLAADVYDNLGFGQPVGVPFGYGQTVAFNNGKQPAMLERASRS